MKRRFTNLRGLDGLKIDISVEHGMIAGLGTTDDRDPTIDVVDGQGALVLPGQVSSLQRRPGFCRK